MKVAFGLLVGLTLVANSGPTFTFRVYARRGNTFAIELRDRDGGTLIRETGDGHEPSPQGWRDFSRTLGVGEQQVASLRVSIRRTDGGECSAEQPIEMPKVAGGNVEVFAAETLDGGCRAHAFDAASAREMFKNLSVNQNASPSGFRRDLGDFPPYTPPHVQGATPEKR